ncbi:hypothetical protein [Gloeocapsopsis dulcis]|uniref:Uncharacterized protein n=1 Tax=Gloeocapsopsis dulcis AAB1 = 1H9 TaxID=1433147 RepID=A0A6N8FSA3_9CHRO|nr:hypothetical protein [Gloeocapsopsis dulcis]MUL34816.1 hypothetical protein [Gloeocapsopsis dulcis AAB1 = 1H9]WNN90116.1 hypothetical protein P0S91_03175 [Gloeocapsopsis dulcis]
MFFGKDGVITENDPNHKLDASNLLAHSVSYSDPRQFLEKCFAQSVEETPSNQPLLLIVLAILVIASATAYK